MAVYCIVPRMVLGPTQHLDLLLLVAGVKAAEAWGCILHAMLVLGMPVIPPPSVLLRCCIFISLSDMFLAGAWD
jgi:hypothetical protein